MNIPNWDERDYRWLDWHRDNPELYFEVATGLSGDTVITPKNCPEFFTALDYLPPPGKKIISLYAKDLSLKES